MVLWLPDFIRAPWTQCTLEHACTQDQENNSNQSSRLFQRALAELIKKYENTIWKPQISLTLYLPEYVCVPEYCVSVPAMCVWMCFVSVNVLIECLITLLLEQNYKYHPPAVRNPCVWFCLVNLSTVCACMRDVTRTKYRRTITPACIVKS